MKIISLNKGLGALWYSLIFSIYLISFPILANNSLRQKQSIRQQIQISGTVSDGINPLPGVTVAVKGQQKIHILSQLIERVNDTDYTGRRGSFDISLLMMANI